MILELHGFALDLSLLAYRDGGWIVLPLTETDRGCRAEHKGITAELILDRQSDALAYTLGFQSPSRTRLRLMASLRELNVARLVRLFHLIPGNIHGDNNAAHVRPGEFPVLAADRTAERNRAILWEFRADRASHPLSILCSDEGAVGISIDP